MRRVTLVLVLLAVPASADEVPPEPEVERRHVDFALEVDADVPEHAVVLWPFGEEGYVVVDDTTTSYAIRRGVETSFAAVPEALVEDGRVSDVDPRDGELATLFFRGDPRVLHAETRALPVHSFDASLPLREVRHRWRVEGDAGGITATHTHVVYVYDDGEMEILAAGESPGRRPSIWGTPHVWVAAAVAGNAVLAFLVLFAVRRRRRADQESVGEGEGVPPSTGSGSS